MATDDPCEEALADDGARLRIATDLDTTLFVEAGAGTGKTRALVGRVVELVLTGRARLGQLAAITFTEAAAAELRARIGARLAELAGERPGDERVLVALGELDEAVVTTIHGFAQRILAEHALAAGLPLRLRVLDDLAADIEFERRFAAFLDELLEERGAREIVVAALAVGISPRHIGQLARQVDEAWDVHADRSSARGQAQDAAGALSSLAARVTADATLVQAALRAACALLDACSDAADTLATRIEGMVPHLASYDPSQGWLATLRWLAALPAVRAAGKGSKARWTRPVEEVRLVVQEYEQARQVALAGACDAVLTALLDRLGRAAGDAALARRSAGELRYHDLLVLTRELLATDAAVRGAVRRRFVQVLVDEFQDTDALQLEIVRLVAGEGDDGRPAPGRLFFVGDPKQAIYRFRGADVALYERVRSEVVGGETTRLVTNFRSVPGVLEWVNRTFAQLPLAGTSGVGAAGRMPEDRGGWSALAASRPGLGTVAVTVVGGPTDRVAARLRRRTEAEELAAAIAVAVRDGWPVLDGDEVRAARFSDVALLVPRRTGLDELESALDARDVPYRVQSSTLVYGSTEVRDVLACLRAVDSPGDEAAIVAALRTPELACGDDDLLEFRQAGGEWRIDAASPPGLEAHPVTLALDEIRRLHEARHGLGVVGTLEAIVADWRALQLASGLRRREEAWRRIMFVLDQARGFVEAGGSSIAELLAWTDHQAERGARAADPVADDDDAVRILTVHGAKGLEFPIVALAELGARPPARRGATVLVTPDGCVEARVAVGIETAGYAELAAVDKGLELEEQARLCYVAATRARDHLVVSLRHTPGSRGAPSLAELLWRACEHLPDTWRRADALASPSARMPILRPDGADPGAEVDAGHPTCDGEVDRVGVSEAGYAAWIARRADLLGRLRRPVSVAAGSLASSVAAGSLASSVAAGRRRSRAVTDSSRGRGRDGEVTADGSLAPWRVRRAATELGRAVHGVLQRVDLATGAGLGNLAAAQAQLHGCPERAEEVRALALSALESPVVRAAAHSASLHREVPVAAPVGAGVVEGVVDLCFYDGDELVVVDYKTDALGSPDEVPAAAPRYRLQVGAYALSLATVLGRPVDRCVLVFLAPPDGAVEHEMEDVAGAAEAARREIELRLSGLTGV